jgi:hypothetical protein
MTTNTVKKDCTCTRLAHCVFQDAEISTNRSNSSVADLGSGVFMTAGSGIRIRDAGSGSGMENNSDPESEMNILDIISEDSE